MKYRGNLLRQGQSPIAVDIEFDTGEFRSQWSGRVMPDEAVTDIDGIYLLAIDEGASQRVTVHVPRIEVGQPVVAYFQLPLPGAQ